MRANVTAAATLLSLAAFSSIAANAASQYKSAEIFPDARTQTNLGINHNSRVLATRQDADGPLDRHVVIVNWSDGGTNCSEFRPGTPAADTRVIPTQFNNSEQITGYTERIRPHFRRCVRRLPTQARQR